MLCCSVPPRHLAKHVEQQFKQDGQAVDQFIPASTENSRTLINVLSVSAPNRVFDDLSYKLTKDFKNHEGKYRDRGAFEV